MNFNLNEIPKDDDAFKKISIYVKALLNKGGKGENWKLGRVSSTRASFLR
jgi:hypothetical protein